MDELQLTFREAMAHVPSPVTVITTMLDGVPTGTTVSSIASLSIDPPMVFFALDNRGNMVDRVRESGRAMINVLSGHQADVAVRFARRDLPDRFAGLTWEDDHGLPKIAGAVAWLRCEELEFRPGGDHTVVLAHVASAATNGTSSLGYHLRQFREFRPSSD